MKKLFLILLPFAMYACSNCNTAGDVEQAKKEIISTEKEFMALADKSGIAIAFTTYADTGAVINRGSGLIKGLDSIKANYETQKFNNAKLKWNASFVDVAASCDLGYTYGTYHFSSFDPMGKPIESDGFFHTVWKKQADGKWKFVWD